MFWTNSFEQQCVILHALLNQGKLDHCCSFVGLNDVYFNSQCLSYAKCLFSETVPEKNQFQVSLDKKGYQYAVLVSFTPTPSSITTANQTGGQISSP